MESPVNKVFEYRLDYYWKSLSLYAVVLSIFILIRESISNTKVIDNIYQPIIFLLIFITVITSIALLYQIYQKKKIILENSKILLTTRWYTKSIDLNNIQKIIIKTKKYKKLDIYKIIIIKLKGKRRAIRINPAYYNNENLLIDEFSTIKKQFNL